MVYRDKVCWVRVIEVPGWVPDFEHEIEEEYDSNDGSHEDEVKRGDLENLKDLKGDSDVEEVPESKFVEESNKHTLEKNSVRQSNAQFEDPFGIYEVLKKKRDDNNKDVIPEVSLKYSPGFTPDEDVDASIDAPDILLEKTRENDDHKDGGFVEKQTHLRNESLNDAQESICSGHFKKSKVPRIGGSILQLIDDLVNVGQTMGYDMTGCLAQKDKKIGLRSYVCLISEAVGNSGGILCFWDPNMFQKMNETVSDYFTMVRGEVVTMGDFNEVCDNSERFGSVFNKQGAEAFNSFISNAGLVEVPLGGCSFTWCHKSATKISKLDRFLISDNLMYSCPSMSSTSLDRYLSNHRPILMREIHYDYGSTSYKFFHYWFEIDGFDKLVEDSWKEAHVTDQNAYVKLMKKLRYLKEKIRMWSRFNKESSNSRKINLKAELADLDLEVVSLLQEVEKVDSIEVAQKAKIKWAIEGDENSKYYHGVLNKKRGRLAIRGVLVDAPGLDGFTFGFYRRYWNLIESDVVDAVKWFFQQGTILKGCNSSFITLIPKVPNVNMVKDFRPISLTGSLYKIIANILANRLVMVLGDLVNEIQSAFVADRQILDGPFILNELVQWCKKKKKQAMIFKVDFEKAYDSWNKYNIDTITRVLEVFHRALGLRINMNKRSRVGGLMSRIQSWNDIIVSIISRWKNVMASKDTGGLGVSSLFALNRALMFKWVWRFISQKSSLWASVIKAFHGEDGKIGKKIKTSYPSIWLNIIHEVELLKSQVINLPSFIILKLGNGVNTSFWDVAWRGDVAFKVLVPILYALETMKNIDVASKLSHGGLEFSFRRNSRGGVEQAHLELLKEKVEGCILSNMNDRWAWSLKARVIFRCRRVNIPCRGMKIEFMLCHMCDNAVESSRHLFFSCHFISELMRKITRLWDMNYMEINSFEEWLEWVSSIRLPLKQKHIFEVAMNDPHSLMMRYSMDRSDPHAIMGFVADNGSRPTVTGSGYRIRRDKRREVHTRLDFGENSRKSQRAIEEKVHLNDLVIPIRQAPLSPGRTRNTLKIIHIVEVVLTNETLLLAKIVLEAEAAPMASKNRMAIPTPLTEHETNIDEEDLAVPWSCEKVDLFTPRICNFKSSRKTRMPNNMKTYDGTGDPEDRVKIFQGAAQVERWAMATWCHMFNSTLIGAARVWFDELPLESIDGYKDLKATFLAYFMQQKKYVKDPVEIHNIKQRDRETRSLCQFAGQQTYTTSDLGCRGLEHHSWAKILANLSHSCSSSFSVMSLGKRQYGTRCRVTYTSVYTDSEPGRVFWGADEELSYGGSLRVIVYGYDGLPMLPVAPPSPDYIPVPKEPQIPPAPQDEDEHEPMFIQPHDPDFVPEPIFPEYIPLEDEHILPDEEQPLPLVVSPTAESPGYVAESDPEEDPEEYEDDETEDGPVDYPMDRGDDGDDDDDGDSSADDTDVEDEDEED
nr:RNA-directed DNA polymerase, eukaryota [Tanacetum cinerariifolium]GEW41556.1 RNA-directed DNA polymerase, eukaryota [Tanacetum cinerariifolium]